MKNLKRILALLGIILLAGLYLTSLVLALTSNAHTFDFFVASIAATVIIPILLWIYTAMYKYLAKHK
ncbi:MAG: hypothetical protein K2P76_10330 [Lachnospiraceae bacterium]|nr:hypothetical protein [Lachnospiraceae bacterium]MDE6980953.1 hypothetical protein [Lachnospiraceae bacterium]